LYVGWTDYAKAAGLDGSTMDMEEWAIKTVASDLILTGGRPRGTLFGVYEFLENNCGVHWFDRESEVVPFDPDFKIPKLTIRDKNQLLFSCLSKMEANQGYARNNSGDMKPEEEFFKQVRFLKRNRMSVFFHGQRVDTIEKNLKNKYPLDGTLCLQDGGGNILGGGGLGHTFYNYISPEEFDVSHPEYFGLTRVNAREKKLSPNEGSLCLTLPEVRTLMVERVKQRIVEDHKLADQLGFQYPRIYALSQQDRSFSCPCPECRRFVKEHGRESDLVTDFVNYVADAVGKDYPELVFETSAYQWSLAEPQTIKPHSNVVVLWCNWGWREIDGGDIGPFLDQALTHPDNQMRFDLLQRWRQVGAKFFFWDYHFLGSAAIPLVETPYTVANIKLLNQLGLLGMMVESEEQLYMFPQSYWGPWHKENFFTFRYWITYQLMSAPDSNVAVLTDNHIEVL
jgi:hypothetical protein